MALAQAAFGSTTSRIELDAQPTDVSFSAQNLLAVGCITGETSLFCCAREKEASDDDVDAEFEREVTEKANVKPPSYCTTAGEPVRCGRRSYASVRSVLFEWSGKAVTTAHRDGSLRLFDAETGRKIKVVKNAHDCEIYRLENVSSGQVASGDDTGTIKFWDVRVAKAVGEVKPHLDYVSDLALLSDGRRLVASSGDTSITVNDVRKLQTTLQSHDGETPISLEGGMGRGRVGFQEEAMALQPLGECDDFVCGTAGGKIALFSATTLHKTHEWFSGGAKIHRGSVDTMIALDDQTMATGCADGVIRVLRFRPHRVLGVIGRHRQKDTVERLAVNGESTLLASIGLDHCVRLWDIQNLKTALASMDDEEEDDATELQREKPALQERAKKRAKKKERIPNFYSDLSQI